MRMRILKTALTGMMWRVRETRKPRLPCDQGKQWYRSLQAIMAKTLP